MVTHVIEYTGLSARAATKVAKAYLKAHRFEVKVGDTIDNDADSQMDLWKWTVVKRMTKTGTTKDVKLIVHPAETRKDVKIGGRTMRRRKKTGGKSLKRRSKSIRRKSIRCKSIRRKEYR
jgi:hypothetical protein